MGKGLLSEYEMRQQVETKNVYVQNKYTVVATEKGNTCNPVLVQTFSHEEEHSLQLKKVSFSFQFSRRGRIVLLQWVVGDFLVPFWDFPGIPL